MNARRFALPLLVAGLVGGVVLGCLTFRAVSLWRNQWGEIRRQVKDIRRDVLWLKRRAQLSAAPAESPPRGLCLSFVGHVYPYNGYRSAGHRPFEGTASPMMQFLEEMRDLEPARVIFGGDSVRVGAPDRLTYLRDEVANLLDGAARFIIGNHDVSVSRSQGPAENSPVFADLFPQPFYYEDLGGMRLVYLKSIIRQGRYGLDPAQIAFLTDALAPREGRAALVFIHHALWAAGQPYVNALYPEPERLVAQWHDTVLPLLVRGNVRAVFSGDGGVKARTSVCHLRGIPHYITGWSFDVELRPPEFLRIDIEGDDVRVHCYVMFDGQRYRSPADQLEGL